MAKIFVIGDTHFGHQKLVTPDEKGGRYRPFYDVVHMNDALAARWNRVVAPDDKVYVLGDFCINRKFIGVAKYLRGRKFLVKGNHDNFRAAEYLEYFEDILGCHAINGVILTHIPIHPDQLSAHRGGRWDVNVHGHLHKDEQRLTLDGLYNPLTKQYPPDSRYICASAERINYTPVELDELLAKHHR